MILEISQELYVSMNTRKKLIDEFKEKVGSMVDMSSICFLDGLLYQEMNMRVDTLKHVNERLRFAFAFWFCDLVLRFGAAFWFCVLLIEDSSWVLPMEDSSRFKTWLRFVSRRGCFLSRRLPAFYLKTSCVLSQDLVAFCLKTSCVLSQDLFHFVSRLCCILSQDLVAFCLKPLAFCLKTYCVLSQEDIQCAGSDTRPPMLDRTDFASWQQQIRLYCRGKENGVIFLKSIDEGPFLMGTVREPLAEGT
uniref:Integrase, catalytic region, zinc finger, CCHC-type, peptidase aspartic, catalytic n=1 Tax=Tanacetum cinerariifolium TaxID=118510 RepID=A0A6L2KLL5_TANCI|nr:integrase, catalytic region, zinc finger, CCHC-type, peptidase aspartic, catalytic [Tanacetum cinerariifolium]